MLKGVPTPFRGFHPPFRIPSGSPGDILAGQEARLGINGQQNDVTGDATWYNVAMDQEDYNDNAALYGLQGDGQSLEIKQEGVYWIEGSADFRQGANAIDWFTIQIQGQNGAAGVHEIFKDHLNRNIVNNQVSGFMYFPANSSVRMNIYVNAPGSGKATDLYDNAITQLRAVRMPEGTELALFHLSAEQTNATGNGDAAKVAWDTVAQAQSWASLASNEVTLDAGKYVIQPRVGITAMAQYQKDWDYIQVVPKGLSALDPRGEHAEGTTRATAQLTTICYADISVATTYEIYAAVGGHTIKDGDIQPWTAPTNLTIVKLPS